MIFLFWIWAAPILYLVFHYLFFHSRLIFFKNTEGLFSESVSVVICAKNEEKNLKEYLPSILKQDYPNYEVLVVDDNSTDASLEILREFKSQYPHLTILENQGSERYIGKKKALSLGIKNAKYDYLLLTDADCRPASENWIKKMVSHFSKKQIILGIGATQKQASFINKVVRWETLQAAIEYNSFALAKMPYMGVGRNLAYEKSLFTNIGGFESHIGLASGDDDLFVSESGEYSELGLQLDPEAFTYSKSPESLKIWWRQKRRHMSTSSYYRFWPKVLLTLYGLSQLSFYLFLPIGIILFYQWKMFWILLLIKFFLQVVILLPLAKRLQSMDCIYLYPIWEFCSTIFVTLVHLQNSFFGKPKAWK